MRSSVDLPQPDGPRIVMKSLSSTASVIGCSATVGAPPRTPGNVRPTPSIASLLMAPRSALAPSRGDAWRPGAHARLHGKSRWFAHLNRKSEMSPITPITMMPKMICPVLSSAWLSVIMWPMPDDAPISSATIT